MAAINVNQNNVEDQKNDLADLIIQDEVIKNPNAPETQTKKGIKRFLTIKKLLITFGLFLFVVVLMIVSTRFGQDAFSPPRGDGEIIWWIVKEDAESLRPLLNKFEDQNPNIKVVLKPQSETDYVERLRTVLAGNDPPEIFEIHKSWLPMFKQNSLQTMPNSVGSLDEFKNDLYPVMVLDLVNNNGLMAMPLYYDALAFYVNQDIFTRAALTPPETWMELRSVADRLTQRGANNLVTQSGVAIGHYQNVDYWQDIVALLMYQNGVNVAKPDGPRASGVYSFYKDFGSSKIWDTRLPSSTDFFAQGNVAMYFGPTNEISNILQQNPNFRFRTELLPQIPKGDPDDPDFSYTNYFVHSVSADSGDKDMAWKLLKFLVEEEQLKELNSLREARGLYPRIYPRPSMASLQSSDPLLGSVVALAFQARGWYLNDDQILGETSLTDRVGVVYRGVIFGNKRDKDFQTELSRLLSFYGIKVN